MPVLCVRSLCGMRTLFFVSTQSYFRAKFFSTTTSRLDSEVLRIDMFFYHLLRFKILRAVRADEAILAVDHRRFNRWPVDLQWKTAQCITGIFQIIFYVLLTTRLSILKTKNRYMYVYTYILVSWTSNQATTTRWTVTHQSLHFTAFSWFFTRLHQCRPCTCTWLNVYIKA